MILEAETKGISAGEKNRTDSDATFDIFESRFEERF